ncbi:MAG: tetratricopeptide repeat protein, partial [Blastocatellia bacterium]
VLISSGRPARAAPYLREALEKLQASPIRSTSDLFSAAGILGECLTLLKRYAEAERLLNESYTGFQLVRGEKSVAMVQARQRWVKLYEAWGKPDKAAQFRAAPSSPYIEVSKP